MAVFSLEEGRLDPEIEGEETGKKGQGKRGHD